MTVKVRAKEESDLYREKPYNPNKRLKLTLPLPLSINHMYINTKHGGKRLSKKAEEYVRDVSSLINLEVEKQHWIPQGDHVWYYIDLVFFMPDRRIRDSHNLLKLPIDVMQGRIFNNDYYVMPRIQGVEYDKENPRVEVLISPQNDSRRQKGLKIAGVI